MFSPFEKSPVNMKEIALHKVSFTPVTDLLDSEDIFVQQVGFDGNLVLTFCIYSESIHAPSTLNTHTYLDLYV